MTSNAATQPQASHRLRSILFRQEMVLFIILLLGMALMALM